MRRTGQVLAARREIPMLNQLLQDDFAQALLSAQNSLYWARAKKLLAVMLAHKA